MSMFDQMKKKYTIYLITLLVLVGIYIFYAWYRDYFYPNSEAYFKALKQPGEYKALSWSASDINPSLSAKENDNVYISAMYRLSSLDSKGGHFEDLLAYLKGQQSHSKAILFEDFLSHYINDKAPIHDAEKWTCVYKNKAIFYPYPWSHTAAIAFKHSWTKLLKAIKKEGVTLNSVAIDYENGFEYWHLYDWVTRKQLEDENTSCNLKDYLELIIQDKNFIKATKRLQQKDEIVDMIQTVFDIDKLLPWHQGNGYLIFSQIMKSEMHANINKLLFWPLYDYFPKASLSNYDYFNETKMQGLFNYFGIKTYPLGEDFTLGNTQSRAFYGWLDTKSFQQDLVGDNKPYDSNSFNALKRELNHLKAMAGAEKQPIAPWVAYQHFEQSVLSEAHYQELIFHLLLSDPMYLLFWNPLFYEQEKLLNRQAFIEDSNLLNELLDEFNTLANHQRVMPQFEKVAIPWRQSYVYSVAKTKQHTDANTSDNNNAQDNLLIRLSFESPVTIKQASPLIIEDQSQKSLDLHQMLAMIIDNKAVKISAIDASVASTADKTQQKELYGVWLKIEQDSLKRKKN